MVKKALQIGVAVIGCLIGQGVWAKIHPVILSSQGCQLDPLDHLVMVCKFTHEVSVLGSSDMWIKTINNHRFESQDGKLKFRIDGKQNIIGTLTINDGQVTHLSDTVQTVNVENRQKPLKLELEYRITVDKTGKFEIPEMMPIEFGFNQGDSNQMMFTPLKVVLPTVCAFRKNSQTINLNSIETNNIRNKGDSSKGGSFNITIDCNRDNAYVAMAFKDANNNSNTSDTLSTKQGSGFAQGVGLQIRHNTNQGGVVKFSPEPASIIMPHQHQWQVMGADKVYHSGFDVYYINKDDLVTAGKVEGNIIATIAFK